MELEFGEAADAPVVPLGVIGHDGIHAARVRVLDAPYDVDEAIVVHRTTPREVLSRHLAALQQTTHTKSKLHLSLC